MARKFITYFDKEGENYTDELIGAVKDKLEASNDIKRILIASATGESALKLYDAVGDDVEIINKKVELEDKISNLYEALYRYYLFAYGFMQYEEGIEDLNYCR